MFDKIKGFFKKKENKLEKYKDETLYKMRNGLIVRLVPKEEYYQKVLPYFCGVGPYCEIVSNPAEIDVRVYRGDGIMSLLYDNPWAPVGTRKIVGGVFGEGFDIVEFYKKEE